MPDKTTALVEHSTLCNERGSCSDLVYFYNLYCGLRLWFDWLFLQEKDLVNPFLRSAMAKL